MMNMMRGCLFMVLLASTAQASSPSSFYRNVVRPSDGNSVRTREQRLHKKHSDMNDALLSKAIPLAEYEARKLDRDGNRMRVSERRLDEHDEGENDDDFYVDYDNMYSFSGYSVKYAKCQPVQYFSEDAIAAGEHSPMVTEDIVILRLCPQKSCTQSAQYGCHYNYAEYAVSLSDYVAVMLRYSGKKRDALCSFCEACGVEYQGNGDDDANQNGGRRLEDADEGEEEEEQEDNQEEEEQEDEQEGEDQEEEQQEEEEENQQQQEEQEDGGDENGAYDCTYVDTYCYDYDNECGDAEADADGNGYLDYEGYLDYLNCAEVNYNDYAYFVRPRCNGETGTIKMAVYYDNYCVQYAGNDVSVKNLGLGFHESQFEDFYSGTCTDCSESDTAPFFDLNSSFCNKLHSTSARCTSALLYNLFNEEDVDTECSFIESIRFGTYDSVGKLSSATNGVTWSTEVSSGQKLMLGISIGFCILCVIYSCYLHHAMTNLLIKSLSHRELLPPSRHRSARKAKEATSKFGRRDSDTSDQA